MEHFIEQQERYKSRIQRFVVYLKKQDPEWVSQREWFSDLHKFDLGENFFKKVFLADTLDPEDKMTFFAEKITKVISQIERKTRSRHGHLECGFTIELEIAMDDTKKEHEILLGYIWWTTIYNNGKNKGEFNPAQIIELEKKLSKFQQKINRIDSL